MIFKPYKFTSLGLGAYLVETSAFSDKRGYFMEGYNKAIFAENGINTDFVQYNASRTNKGGIRGLHYQKDPHGQARFMRCVQGTVFDAAVDVRKGSKTFGQYISATLSAENKQALYLPRGFANGILALSDEPATIVYLVDNYYFPKAETGLMWNDPDVNIKWPVTPKLISKKDQNWPSLKQLKQQLG